MVELIRAAATIRSAIERQIAWSIPAGLDDITRSRARLAVIFAAVFVAMSLGFAILSPAFGQPVLAVIGVVTALVMGAAPWVMRVRRSVSTAAHLIVFAGWLSVSCVALINGGIEAPIVCWLALVPPGANFLAGRRAGVVWLVVCAMTVGLLLMLGLRDDLTPHAMTHDALLVRHLIALIACLVMVLFLMQLHESEKERMLAEIRDYNRELARSRDAARAMAAELQVAQAQLIEESRQQRRLELDLRQAQKLEAVGRLAAGVAHELNTPLQFVSDSVAFVEESTRELTGLIARYREVISDRQVADAVGAATRPLLELEQAIDLPYLLEHVPGALTRSQDGLSRMAGIVRAMKEFAYADQAELVLLDVNRAIANTLTIARAEYRDIADVVTELGEIPAVTCRAGEVNQVFLNIIVNAAHTISDKVGSTGARGLITIRTGRRADAVAVSFTDTGSGIPEEVWGRLFEPFFTTKEVGRGSGQGLAIARSIIVDKHGGTLDFETELGLGTTFRVTLPITPTRLVEARERGRPLIPP